MAPPAKPFPVATSKALRPCQMILQAAHLHWRHRWRASLGGVAKPYC
uniref:Uncharacterized protein n=1 Tax=Arundo donax TaxID=35708 RepID=A0A0A9BIS7_ARUDO